MAAKSAPELEEEPEAPDPESYVGYCSPPKHSRFKPGVCPNPRGRPKKARGRRQILERIMGEYREVRLHGKNVQLCLLEIILMAVRNSTANGSLPAQRLYDWLLSEVPNEESSIPKAVLIVGEKLTVEEWEARYGIV